VATLVHYSVGRSNIRFRALRCE